MGTNLVDDLEGSDYAKGRLRAILSTITGESSVTDAARSIGCNEANLYMLRARTLQEAVHGLLIGIRRAVLREGLHVRRRRRQAGEVERHAADQRVPVRLR